MARLTAEEAHKIMGSPVAVLKPPTTESNGAPKIVSPPPVTPEPATPPSPAPAAESPVAPIKESETAKPKVEDAAITTPEWMRLLESVDPRELAKHPKVSGLVGDLAAKQAKKLARESEAEWAARAARDATAAEEQRLRTLEDADAYAGRDERRRIEAVKAAEAASVAATVTKYQQQAVEKLQNLSPENRAKFTNKNYPGTAEQGYQAFLEEYDDMRVEELTATQLAKERSKWEKETKEALRREILSEEQDKEPSVDTARGNGAAKSTWTDAEILRMPVEDYKKIEKEIIASRLRR